MTSRAERARLVEKSVGGKGEERRLLLEEKIAAARQAEHIYTLAYSRWLALTAHAHSAELPVQSRLASGLGEDSVLEVGISLHRTYGTPIIRGSALKGLAAHYCNAVWGAREPLFKYGAERHKVLFGDTDASGFIAFHDAWITPASLSRKNQGVVLDVMTVHHGPYYMGSDEIAPTDLDDPNPISFLSVAGSFRFAVECADTSDEGHQWGALALELLTQALSHWGAGGKTSSGYGRFN